MTTDNSYDPVAITGIGCRFPGKIDSPETFWDFLCKGLDGITDVPENRWDIRTYFRAQKGVKGKIYTRKGGFLENIDLFDPRFFKTSPRGANFMDPQQRLLLEVVWEALEDGGCIPSELGGLNIGIFMGVFGHDYENIQGNPMDRDQIGPHSATGIASSFIANRVSYFFDFKGPSMSVDTACSSSLVAVHLACQSILSNESDMALAGGVNVIIKPELTMALCEAGMLSPDGYCKCFDAGADGYGRSEGVGAVLLKRLSRALEDNDPIYAVIRGSAVNHDGCGEGLTYPNQEAQKTVLRTALGRACVAPHEVQYIEAHGTGTAVGDPVECNALGSVLSKGRNDSRPCVVGSVKGNFGHTESAAGVAGLIKTALMLKHRMIPLNLHFKTPNSGIDFKHLKLRVPVELEPWEKDSSALRIAGVNSFGFGGTNACVILQEFETPDQIATQNIRLSNSAAPENETASLIPLSAHSSEALSAVAASVLEFLKKTGNDHQTGPADIGRTFSLHRGHHDHRLTIVSRSKHELIQLLEAHSAGEERPLISMDIRYGKPVRPAFVFSGMGQQWWAMGRELLQKEAVFEKTITQCDSVLRQYTGDWSLIRELTAAEDRSRINEARISQPCIAALQIALTELYRSWGVSPDAVLGHSVGEIAAAYAAGILNLEDALLVVYNRSRLQQTISGSGGMLAVNLAEDVMDDLLRTSGYDDSVTIAAVNSPKSITLSGDMRSLEEIEELLASENVFARFLRLDVPYHGPAMDDILPELEKSLDKIKPRPGSVNFFSSVTGKVMDGRLADAAYWTRNVREPVHFMEGFSALVGSGINVFMELGAHPVLGSSMMECLTESAADGIDAKGDVLSTLKRNAPEQILALDAAGKLYCKGYPLNWKRLYERHGKFIKLPSYPFQRAHYWNESEPSRSIRIGRQSGIYPLTTGEIAHPLLGERLSSAMTLWQTEIDPQTITYLAGHVVQGVMIYPAAAFAEMAIAAARQKYGSLPVALEDFEIKAPLVLKNDTPQTLQAVVENENCISIHGRPQNPKGIWTIHASGKIEKISEESQAKKILIKDIQKRCPLSLSRENIYQKLLIAGLEYGEDFQGIEHVSIGENEALGRLKPGGIVPSELLNYQLHPVVLDVCFQIMACFHLKGSYLPVKIGRLSVYNQPGESSWGYVKLTEVRDDCIRGDICLIDDTGTVLARVQGLECRRMQGTEDTMSASIENLLYAYKWITKALPGNSMHAGSTIFPNTGAIAKDLVPDIDLYWKRYKREEHYRVFEPKLDALVIAYILEAMVTLNWTPKKGDHISPNALAERLGIAVRHRLLFNRLLHILKKESILTGNGDNWKVTAEFGNSDASKIWNDMINEHPAYFAELNLARRCGARLANVLQGEEDPLQIMFPQDSSLMEHLYQSSPSFLIYNKITAGVISAILDKLSRGETLRILEIGAGTGALTAHILPLLSKYRTEYVFTDLARTFVHQAQQRFQPFGFVEYQVLDIESDPASQGFTPHSFDIVLEANAIHAVSDLGRALNNIKSLLKPHGMLIMLEGTTSHYALDLTFGMLDGWWLFSDFHRRPSHPLISGGEWTNLLSELDYIEPCCIADRKEKPSLTVIIAKNTGVAKLPAEAADSLMKEEACTLEKETRPPWIVFADQTGAAGQLISLVESKRFPFFLIENKERFRGEAGDFEMLSVEIERILQKEFQDNAAAPVLVNLWNLDDQPQMTADSLEKDTVETCTAVIKMVQALMKQEWEQSPQLWLVTTGTRTAGGLGNVSISHSPVWGLGRSILNEYPDLQLRLVDLSTKPTADEMRALFHEICSGELEDEIALRGTTRYVHRFVRKKDSVPTAHSSLPFALHHQVGGGVKSLFFEETVVPGNPGKGEVVIQVVAAGVNFKDIAKLTGLLDNTELSSDLGFECAGIILKTGKGVKNFRVGDEVMGIVSSCFTNYAVADAKGLLHKPPHFSFEEAATVLVTYLTGYYALHDLARIKKNDRILIHTATGGVGLSAIQIAKAAGARVLATAGTPEKRDFLRAMGIGYVGDSRSLAFADEIIAFTNGEGVDIVFNTLPARTLSRSLSILKPMTGRIIDIVNMYSDELITLRSMIRGVSFFTFDLESIFRKNPANVDILIDTLKKLSGRFENRTYSPLPLRAFPVSDITSAFLHMQKGRHTGKIAVVMDEGGVNVKPAGEQIDVCEDGTYLISGGAGGFGLAAAKWLAGCGAKHLVLIGRSGASSPDAQQKIEEIRESGAGVQVEQVDVTRPDQLRELMDHMDRTLPPLRGVIHAAMVLSDEYVMRMSALQIQKVMLPKVLGAWNLHELTLDKPLDFFICISSFASLVGNTGQANYAAANAFLDSFAHYRRHRNLPALTISLGAVGESGYLMQHPELKDFLKRQGVTELTLKQVWATIRHGLGKNLAHIGLLKVDWLLYREYGLAVSRTNRFSQIFDLAGSASSSGSGDHAGGVTIPEDIESRHAFLAELLKKKAAEALGLPWKELDVSTPLDIYGFDSLMATELVVDIERMTRVTLPKMTLLQGGLTVAGLVEIVEKELDKILPVRSSSKKNEGIVRNE